MIPLARLEPGASRFNADVEFDVLDAAAEEQAFAVHVACDVDNGGVRIQLHGDVSGMAHSQCHRCLEPFDRKVKGGFDAILDRSGDDLGDEVIEVAEDLDEYDLVPLAREAMIVEEPLQLRCKRPCTALNPALNTVLPPNPILQVMGRVFLFDPGH